VACGEDTTTLAPLTLVLDDGECESDSGPVIRWQDTTFEFTLSEITYTLAPIVSATGLLVTTSVDATLLANAIKTTSSGITISGASLIGATNQQGFFSGGIAAGIGIESGVILTTGAANVASGPNANAQTSVNQYGDGDAGISALVDGTETYDANSLSFNVTTDTGNLFVSYVFASEEYNEFIFDYADAMGIFVDGVNIAVVPGASLVSTTTVNRGDYGTGAGVNEILFNNNATAEFNIEYDGFTDVLSAEIRGLTIGATHTIKFVIADVLDEFYDSALFIKAGSLTSRKILARLNTPHDLSLWHCSWVADGQSASSVTVAAGSRSSTVNGPTISAYYADGDFLEVSVDNEQFEGTLTVYADTDGGQSDPIMLYITR
jgi:hypothetical protein